MGILPQIIVNSIIAGSIYSLLALGFNLIFSTLKFFDLSYGALITVGGYMTFLFSKTLGLSTLPAILIAIVISGLLGVALDKLVYKKLREKKASNMIFLIASLGLFTAIQALIAIFFTSQFKTLSQAGVSQQTFNIFGGIITEIQLIIFVTAIVLMVVLKLVLGKTKFGKAVRAISDDEEVSKIVGINTERIIAPVFFISSAIAGLAGIMVGFDTGIEPTMGLSLLLKGIIAAIIGGVGNPLGGVIGAFFLGFIENIGVWQLSGEWKEAIAFAVLIIFLVFRPRGILRK